MNVAVIGGGYAGMAAAVTLADERIPVTVFEAGKTLGGRARRVEHPAAALDNGLHILIGAYRETLRLIRVVGGDPEQLLLRVPFTWTIHGRLALATPGLPAPLHLLAGLLRARGISWRERFLAARFVLAMRRAGFSLAADVSVERLLAREQQSGTLARLLWNPLCVSALNTPPAVASAQVFLNVLRDTLNAERDASDLLLPRVDLSALFPERARAWLEARGGAVRAGQRVTAIDTAAGGFEITHAAEKATFTHAVCALPPHQVSAFLSGIPALAGVSETIDGIAYQPIYSVYLQYPGTFRLPSIMLGFDGGLLQWAFDRGPLCGQAGLVGLVISAEGLHQEHAHDELARLSHQELQQQLGPLPEPSWSRVIAEKRATFACTPGLQRPGNGTPLRNFFLAGDYTASDYPATIEAAVRSGIAAAQMVLKSVSSER